MSATSGGLLDGEMGDGADCASDERLTIDIIVPSFRPNTRLLSVLIALRRPRGVDVSIVIVVDCPDADVRSLLREAHRFINVVVIVNDSNVGASESRNRGIDASSGQYVLFLDDDVEPHENLLIEYVTAIRADKGNHAGFVGVVRFPQPCNGFTRGLIHSGVLTFFSLAGQQGEMPWGVTANLCIRRQSFGIDRFSRRFPRRGGGEDIDLCLRVRESCGGRAFIGVADALADHPWWNSGSRCYGRFVRWAYGDSRLAARHPQYRFINWPTMWEMWLALLVLWVVVPTATVVVVAGIGASVSSEFLVDFARLRRRRAGICFLDAAEAVLIRLSIDLGRVFSTVSRLRPRGFLEHFDFFCNGRHVSDERRVAGTKTAIVIGVVVVMAAYRGWGGP